MSLEHGHKTLEERVMGELVGSRSVFAALNRLRSLPSSEQETFRMHFGMHDAESMTGMSIEKIAKKLELDTADIRVMLKVAIATVVKRVKFPATNWERHPE